MAQLSERGAHFIGRFEGWRNKPYNDPTGNATIGFGHLIHMGPVTVHDNSEWGTITAQRGIQSCNTMPKSRSRRSVTTSRGR
jgi:GH24 family phage-related lysozyme (muramidase)